MAEWKAMFDHHLAVAPPISDEQLGEVPTRRGVLLLSGADDEPITMLTAASLRSRLKSRLAQPDDPQSMRRTADLREITRAVWWKLTPSHFETDLCFLHIARAIWPKKYPEMLAYKKPWLIHVNCDEDYPHFVRTRNVFAAAGRYIGPFKSGRSAEQFIQIIQDGFDLCRDIKCLRQAPNGPPCTYGQMGRCLMPCNGTISMDDYRLVVHKAAHFAAGEREGFTNELADRMKQAAIEQRYERAAAIKTRIDRLGELDDKQYRYVKTAGSFDFLSVHRGPDRRHARVFFVHGPAIYTGELIDYPLVDSQLQQAAERMNAAVTQPAECDDAGPWRMGLVSQYLFSSRARRGVILPWREPMAAGEIARAVEAAKDVLKLSEPTRARTPTKSRGEKRKPSAD